MWWMSALALVSASWMTGLRLILTGSLPVGFYLVSSGSPGRGATVLVCLPSDVAAFAKARGYVPQGGSCPAGLVPVGKVVWAVPGDTVTVTPTALLVNGRPVPNSQSLVSDHRGRPLPRPTVGLHVVGVGQVWVLSTYSRLSFDSRYFGAVQAGQVRAGLHPLWTVGSLDDPTRIR
jgi:conjugative transfer signal peptidase TraF